MHIQESCFTIAASFWNALLFYINVATIIELLFSHFQTHHHHGCRLKATKTTFISCTTLLRHSMHFSVMTEMSTSGY